MKIHLLLRTPRLIKLDNVLNILGSYFNISIGYDFPIWRCVGPIIFTINGHSTQKPL